ncbi:MAG: chemotaxis protein CheW [Anaerophaga sp.]|uniref:chemotaxis protein CheW n=1 Tax=Anaerophaga thermohalophila TaxID=177400 RepID=UPI000237BCB7|nr:chemotaxis protein CheW [Anaerophaga thermohalophila]MBZ4676389.1 chemotaxis protein CheW [Anaerophaga sp.]MDK2841808.1 purine-binding chemotaxis protein CheW [Anaerophaga sp.]MDN5291774.1 purine-binding chemotaxis protein CheW [Anaerophaga sp.]
MDSYLTFRVADEVFAVHVSRVMEIREYERPKPVPQKIEFVSGLIEFRDEVIPLINTGIKFSLKPVEASENTVIVVLDLKKSEEDQTFRVGIMVDAVSDVIEIPADKLKPIRQEYKPGYITGTFNYEGTFVLILDTDKVFTGDEVIEMDKILSKAKKK